MPTYDYRCNPCDQTVEELRNINDTSELICGICGDPMERLISSCNFILQGNGWTGRDNTEKRERIKKSAKMKTTMKEKESASHFQ